MQHPMDYSSPSPPPSSTHASAPPYNYSSSDYTPHFSQIPDHTLNSIPNPNFIPNSHYPQFDPNYPPITNPNPGNYPGYEKFDQFRGDSVSGQSGFSKYDQFSDNSGLVIGGFDKVDQFRADSASGNGDHAQSDGFRADLGSAPGGYSRYDQFNDNTGLSHGGYNKVDQFSATSAANLGGHGNFDQFSTNSASKPGGYSRYDQFSSNSGSNLGGYDKFNQFSDNSALSVVDYEKSDQYRPDNSKGIHGYTKIVPVIDLSASNPSFSTNSALDQGGYSHYDQFSANSTSNVGGHGKFDQFNTNTDLGRVGYDKYDQFSADSGSGLGKYADGVYAYQGSKTEPYGARGTGSGSWGRNSGSNRSDSGATFDDFGRLIGSGTGSAGAGQVAKVVRAVPKAESREDEKGGVQKFRVKLLAESGGQTTMDVLCQIGLDGIRMLDPNTSRTLRIYSLETITRFEVLDSTIFAFWARSSVDIEPKRIRLKSNSYTSNTILDIVTAATIQFKEIGGSSRPADSVKPAEQPTEKRKGLGDWMNLMKPGNEEKDHWVPDEAAKKCTSCSTDFNAFVRRHHCRNCGDVFCDKCTQGRIALTAEENAQPVRVCDRCLAEVTHRLSIAKETSSRSTAGLQSHEDLAKKLQEEMERNCRVSSGSRSDASSKRMKEVECPTCTVHLQVEVPSSGSETIECGVCQHPFLVSAR